MKISYLQLGSSSQVFFQSISYLQRHQWYLLIHVVIITLSVDLLSLTHIYSHLHTH